VIDSFGEPLPGIEMLSTPPATMQSAPSEADRVGGHRDGLQPEEQKRFTETPAVVVGRPASSAAWRPMFGAPWAQLPR